MTDVRLLVRMAGEVCCKSSRTRRRFQRRLAANLEDALAADGVVVRVRDRWSRLFVVVAPARAADAPAASVDAQAVVARARRVFGVSSCSVVDAVVDADLDAIVATGRDLYRDAVRGRSYRIAARRAGRHPFKSRDVEVRLGAALNDCGAVDLESPDVTVWVEVRDGRAYLFRHRSEGPGGLPLGTQGRCACLMSGGFDSAVAAWLLLKRGAALDYVFCNLAGPAFEHSVVRVTRVLARRWSHGDRPRLHVVDFADLVGALKDSVTPRYWQVGLKRLMIRAAETVAREIGASAVATGESLGQVSSQTLANLGSVEAVANLPVLRPLVGFDKQEIVAVAERIGTSALSARVREYCGILEGKPVTAAKAAAVDREERALDLSLLERAVARRRVLSVRDLDDAALRRSYLWVDEVPPGARVIDCRPSAQDDGWRRAGAKRVPPDRFADCAASLDKESAYLLFCDRGAHSGRLAGLMQAVGFEAYALSGGTRKLRRIEGAPRADAR